MGQLNVYLMVNNAPQTTLFNASGDHGNRWIMAQADFTSRSSSFLLFEGIRGTDHNGDIAIDDITVDSGSCASVSVTGTTTNAPITTASKSAVKITLCFLSYL